MIELPVWMVVVLLGLLPIVGLACYAYGWRWRGTSERRIYRHTSRPMTDAELEQFDKVFDQMNRTMDESSKFFDMLGRDQ